jgi:hypothetical protein
MELLLPIIEKGWVEAEPWRLLETFVILWVVWWKLKPHLAKIENELTQINVNMKKGFDAGELRFSKVESRIDVLENRFR